MKSSWRIIALAALVGFAASCGTVSVGKTVRIEQVIAEPPFEATVHRVEIENHWFVRPTVTIWIQKPDRKIMECLEFSDANQFTLDFARSLHPNAEMYTFPKVFADYSRGSLANFLFSVNQ